MQRLLFCVTVFYLSCTISTGSQCIPKDMGYVLSSDSGYDDARVQFASQMGNKKESDFQLAPDLVVFCKNDKDVVDAIHFARNCGYKVSIRSGGHQYGGNSSCSANEFVQTMQIDVSGLETFTAPTYENPTHVSLGVGLVSEQVIELLKPYNLTIPVGMCKSVGVGGHFQTSSLGLLARSFGSGMDHVILFRIALYDGRIERVTAESNKDLYWAVLGGGAGSWGVILDYTFDAIKGGDYPHAKYGTYFWPYNSSLSKHVMTTAMSIMADATGNIDLQTLVFIGYSDEMFALGDTRPYISLAVIWTGVEHGELTAAMFGKFIQPFLDISPPSPLSPGLRSMTLVDLIIGSTRAFDFKPYKYYVHGLVVNALNDSSEFIDRIVVELEERTLVPDTLFSLQFQFYGGTGTGSQLNRNGGKNAFPLRSILLNVDDWLFFKNDEQSKMTRDRINRFRNDTSFFWNIGNRVTDSFMTKSTIDATTFELEESWASYYPNKEWFQRLQSIKAATDPINLFSNSLTIPLPKSSAPNSSDSMAPRLIVTLTVLSFILLYV